MTTEKEKTFIKEPSLGNVRNCVCTSFHYPVHWHDFIELIFIKKGYLQTTIKNTTFTIDEKELLVLMPGELHSFYYEGGKILEYIVIQIDSDIFQNAAVDSREISAVYPYLFNYWAPRSFLCSYEEVKKERVLPLINKLNSETQKKEPGYDLSVRAGLLELFVWILRRRTLDIQLSAEAGNISIYRKLQPALNYIWEHYKENITTNELAEKVNISTPHFCRIFKKLTGYSFHFYLRSLRSVEATRLLLTTDNSIGQIASLVGYNDVNFFIRIFKKQSGIPPLQYKKKYAASLPF